ncbi:hypothetical protein MXM41_12640 [Leclercia adecarboxylata]|uniref:hypothetical protein n=1 Tax=Leclercia adecarboxylata TaxID=83655 RepID=UPI002DBC4FAC|nr:hypothetical protein [Leclercia adecarboxylata]MEB6379772.1 hypothetical protein [Leclercia adecarboxylata]
MNNIPAPSYSHFDEDVIHQLITQPLPASADLFEVADACAALVCVLIDTHDDETRNALCGRLLQALNQLRYLCDADLPPHLVEQLIAGESMTSCMPYCWQETVTPVEYAQALTQALLANTLPQSVAKTLTGLLHDLVNLLAEYVREPYLTVH